MAELLPLVSLLSQGVYDALGMRARGVLAFKLGRGVEFEEVGEGLEVGVS